MLQPKLLSVKPIESSKLLLEYETGEKKIFDVKPYIKKYLNKVSHNDFLFEFETMSFDLHNVYLHKKFIKNLVQLFGGTSD